MIAYCSEPSHRVPESDIGSRVLEASSLDAGIGRNTECAAVKRAC